MVPVSSKDFLDIQATIECLFTLTRVRDMTRTYSQKKNPFNKNNMAAIKNKPNNIDV